MILPVRGKPTAATSDVGVMSDIRT